MPTNLELSLLYINLRPGQTCHSKDGGSCIFRWPVMRRDCVGELGWQYGTGLKSHGIVTNWCTGRGWPVNCMTVISARWWSKHAIPKTAEVAYSVGQLWEEIEWTSNYSVTRCTGSSIRCRIEEHVPERLGPQAPGWAAQENGKETRLWPIERGVNMLQFGSVSNSLSHTTLSNKVRGIFF